MTCLLTGAFISCLRFGPYSFCPRRAVAVAAALSADSQLLDELRAVLPARRGWAAEPSLQRALLMAGSGCFGRSLCRLPSDSRVAAAVVPHWAEPDSSVQSWRCWGVEVPQAAPGMMADR